MPTGRLLTSTMSARTPDPERRHPHTDESGDLIYMGDIPRTPAQVDEDRRCPLRVESRH
jgi:hypothetical protein